VSGAINYTWSTNSNSNSVTVNPTVTTTYSVFGTGFSACSGQASVTVTVNPCVGIKELEWDKNIFIAPNPNNGKFNVVVNANIENAEIKIVNAIGQEVYHQNIKQGKNEINAGILSKGIYHYSIIQNKEPVNRGKILIE
ncbi:MAG TPA: T9SS type A sorting domain-containing protein, partial [Bacteroidia bacterium]|nr:T9SS type A sorting domain-containing protein [Bacteroidia bacterium]